MEIKQISPRRLQIQLTEADLRAAGLAFDEIDCADPKSRGLFLSLLETARMTTDFSPRAKVFIEVYPDDAGGCTVYLSDLSRLKTKRWKVRRPVSVPVIYSFTDVDTLINGSVKLFRRCSHRIRKSALYRLDGGWKLMIYPLDTVENITLSFLDEYAECCGEGPLAAAWLEEHGELVVREDAVDLISAYFG
ncbi:adaptor protein MecA [Anaerotruncus rubiinfantis]|uniref:adaptor protein MecA n=1 Tax=Anaerotruncus rubiinfantis TaxID=1720200 RepID=UPI0034A592DE